MTLATERPLLREADRPGASLASKRAEDVLDDACLLIERLFDKKRVVQDLEWSRAARGRGLSVRARGEAQATQQHRDVHEKLRRGASADGDPPVATAFHTYAVG